jgi:uncharacterized membrane protein
MQTLLLFIIFSFLGVAHEVIWTSLDSIKNKNPRLLGRSTLWMFPIYGAILFIIMFVQWLYADYSWVFRGFMYMVLILVWEYISGFTVKKLVGVAPWEYGKKTKDGVGSKKRYNLHGLICLEYAPIWFIEGLIAEWFYLYLVAHLVF